MMAIGVMMGHWGQFSRHSETTTPDDYFIGALSARYIHVGYTKQSIEIKAY